MPPIAATASSRIVGSPSRSCISWRSSGAADGSPILPERANRLDRWTARSPLVSGERRARGQPPSDPSARRGLFTANAARVRSWTSFASVTSAGSARLSSSALQRDTQPATSARAAGRVSSSTAAASGRIGLQTHEREHAEPAAPRSRYRAARRRRPPGGCERAGLTTFATHPPIASAAAGIADQARAPRRRCPARAATRSASAAISGSRARLIANQAERERRHLPHFRIVSRGQQARTSGCDAVLQADAADGERGAAANSRFRICRAASPDLGGGGSGGGGATGRGFCLAAEPAPVAAAAAGAAAARIAQDALILEPQDPRHLLLERRPAGLAWLALAPARWRSQQAARRVASAHQTDAGNDSS